MLATVVMSVFERHLQTWGIQNSLRTPLVSWLMFWLNYRLSEKITQRRNNPVSLTVVKSSRVSVEEIWRNISLKNNYMQIIHKQTMKLKYVIFKNVPGLFLYFYFNSFSVTAPLTLLNKASIQNILLLAKHLVYCSLLGGKHRKHLSFLSLALNIITDIIYNLQWVFNCFSSISFPWAESGLTWLSHILIPSLLLSSLKFVSLFIYTWFKFFFFLTIFSQGEKYEGLSDCQFCCSLAKNIHLFGNVEADHVFLWRP